MTHHIVQSPTPPSHFRELIDGLGKEPGVVELPLNNLDEGASGGPSPPLGRVLY